MSLSPEVRREMDRATKVLSGLSGEELPTVSITSESIDEAVFLGRNISKLSPIIGNLIESRITRLLTGDGVDGGLRWIRQDPNFPDALLVNSDGTSTDAGFEVKAWYALSTELTGRFRESMNLLEGREIKVVVVAWMMSHIVYGRPQIVDVLVTDAKSVARARDAHYHNPPGYLCVEPEDTASRTANLQQTNVLGYKLQEEGLLPGLHSIVEKHHGASAFSHTPEAQALVKDLMNAARYRLDTNFAKIDRIDHGEIESFKSRVLSQEHRGMTNRSWQKLLRDLANDENMLAKKRAELALQEIYDEL